MPKRSSLAGLISIFVIAGCDGLIALDGYRPCSGGECTPDASVADVGNTPDAGGDTVLGGPCTSSTECSLPTPVCGGSKTCTGVVKLARGDSNHSCAILGDGTLTCWGRSFDGQLGNGVAAQPKHPVIVQGLTGVTNVGVGWKYSCAIDGNGETSCWGSATLGDTVPSALTPHKVLLPPGKAIHLATGPESACVILDNQGVKSVWCWGDNGNGKIAPVDAGTSFAIPVQITAAPADVDEVSVGAFAVCVLHAGRSRLMCWGDDSHGIFASSPDAGTNDTLLPNSPITTVHMGEIHACDVNGSGVGACWGWNYVSAFAGPSENVATPWTLPFSATEVSPAYQGTCALVTDGTVQCAGNNGHGAAGDGTMGGTKVWGFPVIDKQMQTLDNVVDVALHRQFACATQKHGTVSCWGQNLDTIYDPQGYWLGDGTTVIDRNHAEPVVWP